MKHIVSKIINIWASDKTVLIFNMHISEKIRKTSDVTRHIIEINGEFMPKKITNHKSRATYAMQMSSIARLTEHRQDFRQENSTAKTAPHRKKNRIEKK